MNCTQIEKLIPLYVGGDLNRKRAAAARRHIESCERCSGMVRAFEESQCWLRELKTPEFKDAVFDDLHIAIHEGIAQTQPSTSLFEQLAPLCNLRSAIAGMSATVLLTVGYLFYSDHQKSAGKPDTDATPANRQISEEIAAGDTSQQIKRDKRHNKMKTPHRSRRSSSLPVVTLNNHFGSSGFALPSQAEIVAKENTNEDPERREIIRIEIQTADPNIRIIWLAPKIPNL